MLAAALGATAGPETGAKASSQEEFRTWTDRSGKFHAEAVLVTTSSGVATIKYKDGTTVSVPLERLSDTDRRYVRMAVAAAEANDWSPSSEPDESSASGETSAGDDDECVRTEAREDAPPESRARTSCRTTARTAARTTVGTFAARGTRRVVVDGAGATTDEALKDCFRNAVATVMGSIVSAETQVENDRLVLERILTFSDGYVDSYEEIGTAYREGGLVHRRIAAMVRRDSLLVACGRADSVSVDASGLYPEVMTKLERRRNALALLRRTLDMLPGSLLRVQLRRPPVDQVGDTTTALGLRLVIRVDSTKYEALQDRMRNILRCLSRQDGTIEAYGHPVSLQAEPARQRLLQRKFVSAAMRGPDDMCVVDAEFADIEDLSMKPTTALLEDGSRPAEPKGGAMIVIKGQSDWRWFDLDEDVGLAPRAATVLVTFRDSDGEALKTASLPLGPWAPGFAVLPHESTGAARQAVFMSPAFLYYHGGGDFPNIVAARSVTVRGGIAVENALLSRVNTVDASVRGAAPVPLEASSQEFEQQERGLRRTPADSSKQEGLLARRARVAKRSRVIQAATNARSRARNAENQAAFQSMWRAALRRSGW